MATFRDKQAAKYGAARGSYAAKRVLAGTGGYYWTAQVRYAENKERANRYEENDNE